MKSLYEKGIVSYVEQFELPREIQRLIRQANDDIIFGKCMNYDFITLEDCLTKIEVGLQFILSHVFFDVDKPDVFMLTAPETKDDEKYWQNIVIKLERDDLVSYVMNESIVERVSG